MKHSFNKIIAEEHGIEEAILYENISYWCEKNHANKQNVFKGIAWTYNTYEAFEDLFPYIKPSRIKRALRTLRDAKLIDVRNDLSVNKWDKTNWYSIVKKGDIRCDKKEILDSDKNEPSKSTKKYDHNKEQIINTNINSDIKHTNEHFNDLWLMYPRERRTEGKNKVKKNIKERLMSLSKEEWFRIIERYTKGKDVKYCKECFRFLNNEVFESYTDKAYEEIEKKVEIDLEDVPW